MKSLIVLSVLYVSCVAFISCEQAKDSDLPSEKNDSQLDLNTQATDELALAVYSTACYRDGSKLIVYNPKTQDLYAYDSEDFHVKWMENGTTIMEGATIECVCSKSLTVEVLDLNTGKINALNYRTEICQDE